jgi:hypothetical protein
VSGGSRYLSTAGCSPQTHEAQIRLYRAADARDKSRRAERLLSFQWGSYQITSPSICRLSVVVQVNGTVDETLTICAYVPATL